MASGAKCHWQYAKVTQYTTFVVGKFATAYITLVVFSHMVKSINHFSISPMAKLDLFEAPWQWIVSSHVPEPAL
jgi:hypothetical protein